MPDAYEYPIKPGTPEWTQLTTGAAMDSVLQIPDSIISVISTEGLIETTLNYPRFADLYFLDDYQVGFNDPKYFRKYFRNEFGVSPNEYKKRFEN